MGALRMERVQVPSDVMLKDACVRESVLDTDAAFTCYRKLKRFTMMGILYSPRLFLAEDYNGTKAENY